jgi:hypothetical protein
MGRPKGSKNKRSPEQIALIVQKRQETKDSYVEIKSESFTITSDANGWSVVSGGRQLYFSRLDYLCTALLSAKIKRSEATSIAELRESVRRSCREIIDSVGKVYPPNYGEEE